MPIIAINRKHDFVREVTFTKIGNGMVLRVGRLMKAAGADLGTVCRAYRTKQGIFLELPRAMPPKPSPPVGKPRFRRAAYKTYLESFKNPRLRIKALDITPIGQELP